MSDSNTTASFRGWLVSNLTLALVGGFALSLLSYCANYGLFWVIDARLFSAFTAVELVSNFAILVIPLILSSVVAWGYFEFYRQIIAKEVGLREALKAKPIFTSLLLLFVLISTGVIFGEATDGYQLSFDVGVGLVVLVTGFSISRRHDPKWRNWLTDLNQQKIFALAAFFSVAAWTVASFGAHTGVERMREWKTSELYLQSGSRARKIVVLFASPERAVIFDGKYVRFLEAARYSAIITVPNPVLLDNKSYISKIWAKL